MTQERKKARRLLDTAIAESGWSAQIYGTPGSAGYALYWALQMQIEPLCRPWYRQLWADVVDVWEGTK